MKKESVYIVSLKSVSVKCLLNLQNFGKYKYCIIQIEFSEMF